MQQAYSTWGALAGMGSIMSFSTSITDRPGMHTGDYPSGPPAHEGFRARRDASYTVEFASMVMPNYSMNPSAGERAPADAKGMARLRGATVLGPRDSLACDRQP